MAQENVAIYGFNRGLISPLAIARTDLKRTAFSAETMVNWVPRVFGSMLLRPGWQHIGSSLNDSAAVFLPFVFAIGDTALVEITNQAMRVWINDVPVTRANVSSAVVNGGFDTNLTSWTGADEAGATSDWDNGTGFSFTGGYLRMASNGTAHAIRRQTVTVTAGDLNVEHALRIVIANGPVTLRVGSTVGGDEYITETSLGTGTHSLAFTPTGSFTIQFSSSLKRRVLVDSCNIESAGIMAVAAPWLAADLKNIRMDQSADVLECTCANYQQRKVERRAAHSWSVVLYAPEDGPFRTENVGSTTIAASGLSGNVTLTASAALFRLSHVGALFRIVSVGQNVTTTVTAQNTFSNSIRVTGISTSRAFTIIRSGLSGTGSTATLQRSTTDSSGPWVDVGTYTTDDTISLNDGLDNQITWYRIGVKTGNYVAGTIVLTLNYPVGSVNGIARITNFTSSTSVAAEVLTDLGGTIATNVWSEGEWSTYRGFPMSVAFAEGRLWWSGKDHIWGSVSDAFESFDDGTLGDSAPISRTLGSGPIDTINWLLSLRRLLVGGQCSEFVCKSTSLDEPLTPTNFNIKKASTQGSAAVQASIIDNDGVYVQRGGTRIMQLTMSPYTYEFSSTNLTLLAPEVCGPGVSRMVVQRQPDTRIHCVRTDGSVAICVFDPAEEVRGWFLLTTDGAVEDVVVLPGTQGSSEDLVYYSVNRTINGATKRYLERWATEAQCVGGTDNRQADSYLAYSGSATTTITGLSHLEAKTVVVWGNGKNLGSYTVTGGQITGLSETVTSATVGLGYTAQWKSTKLAYAADLGTPLTQKKTISHLGVILRNTYATGLKYGTDFSNLYDLPAVEGGVVVDPASVYATYDTESFSFGGTWDTDARLCLQAQAPNPCTILAAVITLTTNTKI